MQPSPQPIRTKPRRRKERYVLLKLLGQGGMGSVYKAEDLELDRIVALKLLHPMLASDEKYIDLLKHEVVVASRISHPNIVRTFDIGELHRVPVISMALVEGESLSQLLKRTNTVALPRAVHFARQVCSALEEAHRAGVVHRDLKPGNLLIDRQGSIYISDFGMAHLSIPGKKCATNASDRPGTPRFMSPEQFHALPVDGRSDLFAFGLILYQMLVGRALEVDHRTRSVVAIDQKTRREVTIPPYIPEEIRRVVLRCLRTSPEERYQSAREILAELPANPFALWPEEELEQDRELAANPEPESLPVPETQAASRPRWRMAKDMALVFLLVMALCWLVQKLREDDPGGERSHQEEFQRGNLLMQAATDVATTSAAAAAFEQAARLNPRHGKSYAGLARANLRLWQLRSDPEKLSAARHAIDEAARLGENGASAQLLLAEIDIASGNAGSALAVIARLMTAGPVTDEMWRTKARGLYAIGNRKGALESAKTAVDFNPRFWMNHNTLGNILKAGGHPLEAVAAFRRVVELYPSSSVGYVNLGGAQVDAGDYAGALPNLERALQMEPSSTQYTNLGTALFYIGSCFSAVEIFRKAVDLSPNAETHVGNLGDAHRCAGHTQEASRTYARAIELAREALRKDPRNSRLLGRLALYLAKTGQMEEAEAVMGTAVATAPANPVHHYQMAVLLTLRNQYSSGAAALREALKAGYSRKLVLVDPELRPLLPLLDAK